MYTQQSSISLIKKFLEENGIDLDPETFIKDILVETKDYAILKTEIIEQIIGDAYNSSKKLTQLISKELSKKLGVYLGSVQKQQLKKYLDYEINSDFDLFFKLLNISSERKEEIQLLVNRLIKENEIPRNKAVKEFLINLKAAIYKRNTNRIKDYITFLYSRLLSINEQRKISLSDIFKQEENNLRNELDKKNFEKIKDFCLDKNKFDRETIIQKYVDFYLAVLENNNKNKKALFYLNIDQFLFDSFSDKGEFYSFLLAYIMHAFEKLQNHKALVLRVQNVMCKTINIKWEIYSYLVIFSEKFRKCSLSKTYYKPETIFEDVFKHKFNRNLSEEEKIALKNYYSSSSESTNIQAGSLISNLDDKLKLEYFKEARIGFTFTDCFILISDREFPNSEELSFIKNNNELLLVFLKNEVDEKKIPCPICGSIEISGNSYPEIGIKSWECKNPLCSARSKTNRGKRYSKRSYFMQKARTDFRNQNIISKELVNIWRKDVVEKWDLKDLYLMLIKFFTFVGDLIEVLNIENEALFSKLVKENHRNYSSQKLSDVKQNLNFNKQIFKQFFGNNLFFNMFLYKKYIQKANWDQKLETVLKKGLTGKEINIYVVQSDNRSFLENMKENSIHNMITSPPYYNARLYNQWTNLYNYLNDMYNTILVAKDVLIPGGVFFYNIGDVYDNENIIVKSKMGEKRIPLGAYIVLLFQKAGFQLLDNIIWYKGEPQSNRHKNDGNFTPYYQRPTNCYEHIFIFKKKGTLKLNADRVQNLLKSNIQKFSPVIKINSKGENRYGHSAPFPPRLPLLSILCFTNPGEVILDPYSGSGTTSIIAYENKRSGISIDISEEYTKLSIALIKKKNFPYYFIKQKKGDNKNIYEIVNQSKPATLDDFLKP